LHDNLQRESHKPCGLPTSVTWLQLLRRRIRAHAQLWLQKQTDYTCTSSRTLTACDISLSSLALCVREAGDFVELSLLYMCCRTERLGRGIVGYLITTALTWEEAIKYVYMGINLGAKQSTLFVTKCGEFVADRISSSNEAKPWRPQIKRWSRGGNSLTRWLLTQDTEFYQHTIETIVPHNDKCFSGSGDYVEKQWDSGTITSELYFIQSKIKNPKYKKCTFIWWLSSMKLEIMIK